MRLAGIKEGDLVKCDVKGRIFYAEVIESPCVRPVTNQRGLRVKPLLPNQTRAFVTATEVTKHWAQRKG